MTVVVEQDAVDDLFRERMLNSIKWLTRELSVTRKKEVVASADVPGLIIALARGTPATDPEDRTASQRLARAIQFKHDLIKRAGGVLTVQEVKTLLRYKSAQAVHKAEAGRRLLAVMDNDTKLFPAFQFDGSMVRPVISKLLAATPTTSGWALLQFLVEGDEGLGEDQPLDLINGDAKAMDRLLRFAGTLEV